MKKTILFFGKLPPPHIGPAIATEIILSSELQYKFRLIHFDTSHHSKINEIGKWKVNNIWHAFISYLRLIKMIMNFSPDIVYIPSQQATISYLRDIPYFIITKILRKKLVCHLRGGYFLQY